MTKSKNSKNEIESLNTLVNELTEELSSVYESLTSLYRIIGTIKSIHDPVKLFSEIVNSSTKITKSDYGTLYLVDKNNETRKVDQIIFKNLKISSKDIERLDKWLVKNTVIAGESILIENMLEESRLKIDPIILTFHSSICSILLQTEGRKLGVLNVYRFQDKPHYSSGDFKLLKALSDQASVALDNILTLKELIHQQRIERELEIAAEIQRHLYPSQMPVFSFLDIAARNIPAHEVGGDYYDLVKSNEGLACSIGDVMGKGVPAALFASIVRSVVRTQFHMGNSIAEIMSRTNRFLYYDLEGMDMFLTLFIGFIEQKTKALRFCNAGHNPVILLKSNGKIKRLQTEGLLVGVRLEGNYGNGIEHLEKGDIIVFYTDGITEAMDKEKNIWGEERLVENIKMNKNQSAEGILDHVFNAVDIFSDKIRNDDSTMIIIKVTK